MQDLTQMLSHVIKRLLMAAPVVFVVVLGVFFLLHLTPGDPAAVIAGDHASAADVERVREQLGLNDPLYIQFRNWTAGLLRGDLGRSIFSNLPVTLLISQRLEPTLMLALVTLCFATVIAVPLGALAAWRAGSFIDCGLMIFSAAGFSTPAFVVGYSLIYLLSVKLHWFPVQGYKSPFSDGLWPFARHITLPALTLSLIFIALIARITRAALTGILMQDYIRTARAKGQSEIRVFTGHALPNAAVPIVTAIGLSLTLLIGGVVVTESVFNIPGLGRLIADAVQKRDYPVIHALILLFSLAYILLNLLIDIIYVFLDPRIRY